MAKILNLLFCVFLLGPAPLMAQSSAKLQQQEIVRRQELVFRSTQAIGEAQKAETAKNLAKAQENYRFALANLTDAPATRVAYATAVTGLTRVNMTLYAQARENGDAKTAKLLVEEIVRYNPQHGPANAELEKIRRAETDPNDTSLLSNPALNEKFRKDVETVESLYTEAEQFRRTGQLDEATVRLKKILAIDPYNKTASALLSKIAQEKRVYAEKAQAQSRQKALADVEARWSEPSKRDVFGNLQATNPIPITRSNQFQINQKLRSIIIPSLEFKDASIEDAVAFLNAKSKELDPEKQGINFILRPDVSESAKTFTLNLTNVPLEHALRYITHLAGVKYKVEEFAILVVRLVDNTEVLLRRQFNVPPSFFPSTGAATAATPAAATGVRRIAAPVVTNTSAGVAEVKEALEAMGVEFPPGATAVYLPASGILQVQNAQAQLDLIQALVEAQGGQTLIVDVSVKLVEIAQEDLNDLTFNYSYLSQQPLNWSSLPFMNAIGFTTSMEGSQGMRAGSLDQLLLSNTGTTSGGLTIPNRMDLTGIMDGGLYNVIISALAQKRSTDLLSSPSVRVKNGEDAKINISRTFFFPTAFDPPETLQPDTGDDIIIANVAPAVIAAFPNEFESRDIGVKLTVRPQVGADNRTIDLSLLPEITDFEGFINYGDPIFANGVLLTPNVINQPVFNTRKVNTKVFVQDGNTVLLAGLIREDTQEVNEKLPVLGDIPFIGRLFQSKANKSIKKNLLIFVTTRILRPDGDPFNVPENETNLGVVPVSSR
jgi:general secretion pathway protein D